MLSDTDASGKALTEILEERGIAPKDIDDPALVEAVALELFDMLIKWAEVCAPEELPKLLAIRDGTRH
jgi:hypothetical protein